MNIFILDRDPFKAAENYCDKHIPKMVLELGQMLSTAHRLRGTKTWDGMYREAYVNHPCTKWVRESRPNYRWAAKHFFALANQYQIRFGKMHKTFKDHGVFLYEPPALIDASEPTPFAQAMPDDYKNDCAVTAYRTYYLNDKKRFAVWQRGVEAPDWWIKATATD